MNIVGADFLRSTLSQDGYFIKLVFNARAAYFFPYTTEHRDASLPGLCYRDDSTGDALAATIKPRQIDIRLHREFSPELVKSLVVKIEQSMDNAPDSFSFDVYYGAKHLTTIQLGSRDPAE